MFNIYFHIFFYFNLRKNTPLYISCHISYSTGEVIRSEITVWDIMNILKYLNVYCWIAHQKFCTNCTLTITTWVYFFYCPISSLTSDHLSHLYKIDWAKKLSPCFNLHIFNNQSCKRLLNEYEMWKWIRMGKCFLYWGYASLGEQSAARHRLFILFSWDGLYKS